MIRTRGRSETPSRLLVSYYYHGEQMRVLVAFLPLKQIIEIIFFSNFFEIDFLHHMAGRKTGMTAQLDKIAFSLSRHLGKVEEDIKPPKNTFFNAGVFFVLDDADEIVIPEKTQIAVPSDDVVC
ncbi:MAG: hypothetical protein IPJ01_07210, partial [Micavibrio sp.]|nr:hypothetical protein [Micavibrio sp.]